MSTWFGGNELLIQATLVGFLAAASMQVPFRWGVFSFAGIGAYAISAYGAGLLVLHTSVGPWTAIATAAVASALICYLFSFLVQHLGGLYLGMATIAFDLVLVTVAENLPYTVEGLLFGVTGGIETWQIVVLCLFVMAGLAYTEHGRLGRRVEAISHDPELALAMGIRLASMRRIAFALSGFVGGLAGGVAIMIFTAVTSHEVGFHMVVTALTMVIIGGLGSWMGALIGAIIVTWLPEMLQATNEWKLVLFGAIVTLMAVWLPQGILGLAKRIIRRMAAWGNADGTAAKAVADAGGGEH